jgi:hypothetical protein
MPRKILSLLKTEKEKFAAQLFRNAIYCAFTDAFFWDKQNLVSWHNCDAFWHMVLVTIAEHDLLADEDISRFIESQQRKHAISDPNCPINALFVFDEARELLPVENAIVAQENCFLATRRAMFNTRSSMRKFRLFVVYLDTHSKMANFSPPKHSDSSSARLNSYELQNPFVAVSNHPWLFSVDHKLNRDHRYDPRFFGRSLWKTTLDAKYTMVQVLDFAVNKLTCSSVSFSEMSNDNKYNSSLAVLCCCLGLSVVPSSEKASKLVASHMVCVLGLLSCCFVCAFLMC